MKRAFFNMPAKARFVFMPIVAAAFLSLVSYIVMQLWNNLLPEVIHVGTITFWQAMGIFILCKILFGFGRMGGGRGFGPGHKASFKQHLSDRFKNMSAEKRARFEERFGEKMWDPCRNYKKKEDNEEQFND